MTQEDEELLLKDLCARCFYGVKVKIRSSDIRTIRTVDVVDGRVSFVENDTISPFGLDILHPTMPFRQQVKPYLRPMSSMTEEEAKGISEFLSGNFYVNIIDWLNAHHFDYRGLIPMGLALEAPEGM